MSNRIVFITTIFPASEEYLDDFFISLEGQTYKSFDVLVINDGIKKFELFKQKYHNLNIIEFISEQTPAKNREAGINKALELNYEYFIFGDSDDYFSENRVEKALESLIENDIAFNDLTIFSKNDKVESFFDKNIIQINKFGDRFLDSNVFGLSNVALRSEILEEKVNFDNALIAVDWYFVTTLLIQKKLKTQFLDNVQTYYRQYIGNTIGMSLQLDEHKLNLGISVKEKHYSTLIKYCQRNNLYKYSPIFEKKLNQTLILREKIQDLFLKKKYIDVVNKNLYKIFNGWWSEIITLEDYKKYENTN